MKSSWTGFHSPLAPGIDAFLAHKRALGCQFHVEDLSLRLFDSLLGPRHDRAHDGQELPAAATGERHARGLTRAVDAAGAVDAQTASTAPWKSPGDFHKRPPPSSSWI